MPGCRYTLDCRVPLQATSISLISTIYGSEQRVAGISRYTCFCHRFRSRCVREASRNCVSVICLSSSHLQLQHYVTYSAGHFKEMQNENLGGFMPLSHVRCYLDKYLFDCGHADAVVVVDDTPAMAAKIAMSDESGRTNWRFLQMPLECSAACHHHAVHVGSRSAATWDTQEEWLLRGNPLWVLDSNRGHEGHQKVHAAEAVQKQIVTCCACTYLAKPSQAEEDCQGCTNSGYCSWKRKPLE